MKLNQAVKWLMKGKVVVGEGKKGAFRYFLFRHDDKIYYVHDETINEDKKKLAVINCNRPHLLASSWWENIWEVYKEKSK